jgi:hypothetical protein
MVTLGDLQVEQITNNVLDRFSASGTPSGSKN